MALPTYVASGSMVSGVGAITPPLPAGIATDDILYCEIEHRSGQAISIPTPNGGTWTALTSRDVGGTTATRLTVFWSRYNGTQGDPTTSDSGDHQVAVIHAFRGCVNTGDPHEGEAGGTDAASDTALSASGSTTTGADRLVLVFASRDNDAAGAHYSAWANSDLANLTERFDDGTVAGNGGGMALVTGEKATPGTYGATTATLAVATTDAFLTVALIPSAGGPASVTGAAALTGMGSISASGIRQRFGAAALSGLGSVTGSGVVKRLGAAALTGVGSSSAAGVVKRYGAAALTGTGSLSVVISLRRILTATAATARSLIATPAPTGVGTFPGATTFPGSSTLPGGWSSLSAAPATVKTLTGDPA